MALVSTDLFHCVSVPKSPVSEVSPSATHFVASCFVDSGVCGISNVRENELSVHKTTTGDC